ncbi:MAG: M66 family metalloprotease [Pseudoxanthomonas sp.]
MRKSFERVWSSARVALLCSGVLALAACGGGGGGDAPVGRPDVPPPTTTPPVTPPGNPLQISQLEVAQTHVMPATGLALQSRNDASNNRTRHLRLTADRAALLMVTPLTTIAAVQVRARLADGRTLGPVTLSTPAQLPPTDGGRSSYSTLKYSTLMPSEWIQIGVALELSSDGFTSTPINVPLTVAPASALKLYTAPIYLFGATHANSVVRDYRLSSFNTASYPLDVEYREKLPVAAFEQAIAAPVTMNVVTMPARNDAQYCYPAMSYNTWAEYQSVQADTNARMLGLVGDLHGAAANRDDALGAGFYGYIQAIANGTQVAASTGGGLGYVGGGASVSGGDYRPEVVYSAIFNHEMGHGYSLPHADSAYDSGDYPYPFGTKSGSTWGYDSVRNELLSTRQLPGKSCDGRTVDGVCYARTPMSGGDDDRDMSRYRWTNFSDYQAAMMQEWLLGKLIPDASYAGGYKTWNLETAAFEQPDARQRAQYGTDVVQLNQSVQTVVGSLSHFDLAPTASRTYVTPTWTGNLPRHFDPTVQADLDLMQTTNPGGWDDYYCVYNGCDYTLVASYNDGTQLRVLLPIGFHAFNNATAIKPGAQDVLSTDNFAAYAVNLPTGRGGLARIQVYRTPLGAGFHVRRTAIAASALGSAQYPLVNQWVLGDGNGGGAGAGGATASFSSRCQAGATVRQPPR